MFKLVGSRLGELEQQEWSNEERRAYVRFPANAKVHCFPLTAAGGAGWLALVRDISTLGIGLVLGHCPDLSTLVEIQLHRRNGTHVRKVLARVVHVEEESSRTWSVGCAFIQELQDEDLAAFHAEAVHPAGSDCRRWQRFPCNVATVCYTSETAPGERCSGRILNISAGGVGLLLRCQFSKGNLLAVELPEEMDVATNKLLVRVIQVIDHGKGNWFHGCEYTDELAEDELGGLVR